MEIAEGGGGGGGVGGGIWPPGFGLGLLAGEGGLILGRCDPSISSSCERSTASLHLKPGLYDLVQVLGTFPAYSQ